MGANLTVAQLFKKANHSPSIPVPWGTDVTEPTAGVYVVARVGNPEVGCKACALPFIHPLPPHIVLDLDYERRRWLPREPIVYIGTTHRAIGKRVTEFHRHKCGDTSPHAGGQVVKLLQCSLWVYWSPANSPYVAARTMIRAFRQEAGQVPFANNDGKRNGKRVRLSD
jgi:hypothetical protein